MSTLRYHHGHPLAPEVRLNERVLGALIFEYYLRAGGGHCDRCPSTKHLRLVRRDGEERKRGIYGLADIVNAGQVVGRAAALPAVYAVRCASCLNRASAAKRSRPTRETRPRPAQRAVGKGGKPEAKVTTKPTGIDRAPSNGLDSRPDHLDPLNAPEVAEVRAAGYSGPLVSVTRELDFSPLKLRQAPRLLGWIVTRPDGRLQRFPKPAPVTEPSECAST